MASVWLLWHDPYGSSHFDQLIGVYASREALNKRLGKPPRSHSVVRIQGGTWEPCCVIRRMKLRE